MPCHLPAAPPPPPLPQPVTSPPLLSPYDSSCTCLCPCIHPQKALDGPVIDYEGTMETKSRLARAIFDAAGHKSLDTPAYKV